ncbi:methylcobamide--CoM methyltransferase [Candidatus Bathyarchaeota archaeon]|nr:MAG: methylcobamide--CoM methyltransferase [Candidatus Bathyarchaeota archaeon]
MEMTPKKRALLCLTGNKWKADRVSAFDPLTTATVEQMEIVKAPFPDAHRSPKLMAKLAAAAWEIVGLEGFKVPFDLCVQAEALGAEIHYGALDIHPSVRKPAFKELEDFKIPERILEKGRFPVVEGSVKILREKYGDYLPICRQVVGPFTIAGHVFGVEKFCAWIKRKDPEDLLDVLLQLADLNVEEARAALQMGADVICIADPTASSDILSPQTFKELLVPAYQRITSKVGAPVVLHICGNATSYLPYLPDTGIDAFSCDAQVDIAFAKQVLGNRVAVWGNVPTVKVLLQGTPEDVKRACIECICKGTDGLIPSCGIPPRTPIENFRMLPQVASCMVYV